jgi:hypothetical protein
MGINKPGIGNSAAYQVSGWPYITSSYLSASVGYYRVQYPSVAKSVTIKNVDALSLYPYNLTGSTPILVFFGRIPTGSWPAPQVMYRHCISIPVSGSFTFNVKHSQVFIAKQNINAFGAFECIAELTNCDIDELYGNDVVAGLSSSIRDGVLTGTSIDF